MSELTAQQLRSAAGFTEMGAIGWCDTDEEHAQIAALIAALNDAADELEGRTPRIHTASVHEPSRCGAVDESGNRCGNYKGHRGAHTILVATVFQIAEVSVSVSVLGAGAPATQEAEK